MTAKTYRIRDFLLLGPPVQTLDGVRRPSIPRG
jgi:hypothetical protein